MGMDLFQKKVHTIVMPSQTPVEGSLKTTPECGATLKWGTTPGSVF